MIRVDSAIQGVHAKQGCYICGEVNKLVDTEVAISYEGILAICSGCAKDLAHVAGWDLEVRAEEVTRLRQAEAQLITERDSADKALSEVYAEAQAATKRHKERQRKLEIKRAAE
jgi:hypothetical protein